MSPQKELEGWIGRVGKKIDFKMDGDDTVI